MLRDTRPTFGRVVVRRHDLRLFYDREQALDLLGLWSLVVPLLLDRWVSLG